MGAPSGGLLWTEGSARIPPELMSPRHFYRWKSFWFGLLVLVFLGWGWWRSLSHLDIAGWVYPGATQAVFVRSNGGWVHLYNTGPNHSIAPAVAGLQVYTYRQERAKEWFPVPFKHEDFGNPEGGAYYLSHWILMLLFLLPWTGWLAWRGRRLRRLQLSGAR